MSIYIPNNNRKSPSPAQPFIKLQRSTCKIKIFRWDSSDITKLVSINATNDQSIAGKAQSTTSGNLNIQHFLEIQNDVVRCNINKSKSGSSGNFSITLKRGKEVKAGKVQAQSINYLELINPGDWIMIYMKKSGDVNLESTADSSGFKFLGIIENVRYVEVDDPKAGIPRLEYLITGRDFGKVFDMDIFFNPILNQKTLQTLLGANFLSDSSKTVDGVAGFTPDTVIKKLVDFYLGGSLAQRNTNNQSWYIPSELGNMFGIKSNSKSGGISFIDILDTTRIGLHKYINGKFNSVSALPGSALISSLPSNGTVWSILQHLQNTVTNELFTELTIDSKGNLKPALILRQFPFSNKEGKETNIFTLSKKFGTANSTDFVSPSEKTYFIDLPKTTLKSTDIKQKNVGKSDHERINHVMVVPRIDNSSNELLYTVGLNVPSVQRYGLKSIQSQTPYVLGRDSKGASEGIIKYLQKCVSLMEDWFFASHNFYNGTIITDGMDKHVAIGTNLYIEDVHQLYHIEGYTHTYEILSNGQISYTTEFRVSRGLWHNYSTGSTEFIGKIQGAQDPVSVTNSMLEGTRIDKKNK